MGRFSSEYNKEFSKQEPDGSFLERPMARRNFLRLGTRAAALAMAGDTIAGEVLWGGTNPEIHTIDNPEAARRFPDTYTLAIGGFNVSDVEGLGRAVEAILPGFGQVAYLKSSTNGLDMRDIEREAVRFIKENNVSRLRLYGHSMGGMVAVQLGAMLKDNVDTLEAIMLDCTPASHFDLRGNKQTGVKILEAADTWLPPMGPGARFLMEAASPLMDGRDDVVTVCLNAMNKVVSPRKICSNQLVEAQASLIRTFNAAHFNGTFSDVTSIIRLRPADYDADGTIDNRSSFTRWEEGLGRSLLDVPVVGSGHADPGTHREQYGAALGAAARTCHFYDGRMTPQPGRSRPV